jgi:ankyrin repeat protein
MPWTQLHYVVTRVPVNLNDIKRVLDCSQECETINCEIFNGDTVLHLAVTLCAEPSVDAEIVGLLIGKGADRALKNHRGFTPLHEAVSRGVNIMVLEALLKSPHAPVDVLTRTDNGQSALQLAVLESNNHYVMFLLEHGAYVDDESMALALEQGDDDIVETLFKYRAPAVM